MTDPTYDPALASRLRAYADGGVRPINVARDRRGRDREPPHPHPPERATGADAPRGSIPHHRRGRGCAGWGHERRPDAANGFGRLRLRGRRAPIALARRPGLERIHRARPVATGRGRLPGWPAFRLGRDTPRRRRPGPPRRHDVPPGCGRARRWPGVGHPASDHDGPQVLRLPELDVHVVAGRPLGFLGRLCGRVELPPGRERVGRLLAQGLAAVVLCERGQSAGMAVLATRRSTDRSVARPGVQLADGDGANLRAMPDGLLARLPRRSMDGRGERLRPHDHGAGQHGEVPGDVRRRGGDGLDVGSGQFDLHHFVQSAATTPTNSDSTTWVSSASMGTSRASRCRTASTSFPETFEWLRATGPSAGRLTAHASWRTARSSAAMAG